MFAILYALGMFLADLFKSRSRLKAENLSLRHQLNVALRQAPPDVADDGKESDQRVEAETYASAGDGKRSVE
jgi:hypothetical protein